MPRPPLTPEQWAQARRLRDGGATFAAIAREIGAHESTIASRASLEGWPRPAGSLPAAPRGTGAFHRTESIADKVANGIEIAFVAHWHEHREPIAIGAPGAPVQPTVYDLLQPYRQVRL